MTLRLGAVFPQAEIMSAHPDDVVDFVQQVEEAGYDHLLLYDHVLGADSTTRPGWAGFYDHRDEFLEPFVLFAYVARSCALELVTDVLVLPQRQTALVAKQAATLETLAPGRLRLGVGIGWNEVEYEGLGVDFATRAARLEEQIVLLRRLWSEETLDHAGATDRITAAGIAPRPTRMIPIWIGSGTDVRALVRVGRLADGWLPMPQVQPGRGFEDAWAVVRRAAEDSGREPDAVGLEGQVLARVDDPVRLREHAARWRDAGAGAVAVNALRAGHQWPGGHLGALRAAAEILLAAP